MMMNLLKYTLLIFLLSFAACSSDDDGVPSVPNGQPQPGDALELTVSAADFVTDGAPDTRATDNDKTTTFENDDRVGVIILDEDDKPIYNNIPYKYNNGKWTFDSGNDEGKGECYYDSKATTFIVYYPYSHAADGVKSVDDLKAKFPPKFDQSNIKDYRASDLMVWSSNIRLPSTEKNLNAKLTHAFASVTISPIVRYLLDDGASTPCIPSSLKISDVNFTINGAVYVPFQATDGSLRCIVPADINPSIRCFYTIGSKTYGNTIIIQNAVKSNTRYTSSPEIINKTYTLADARVGDFYCRNSDNNGYLIPADVYTLSPKQQDACVGIVFWVNDADTENNADPLLNQLNPDCYHGLVVSLRNAELNGDEVMAWTYGGFEFVNAHLRSFWPNAPVGYSTHSRDKMQGYSNTIALEKYNAYLEEEDPNNNKRVKPIYALTAFATAHSAPKNSSDWYWPAIVELKYVCWGQYNNSGTSGKDYLNIQISKVNGTKLGNDAYWPSTESNDYYVLYVNFNNGTVGDNARKRSDVKRVRPILAF